MKSSRMKTVRHSGNGSGAAEGSGGLRTGNFFTTGRPASYPTNWETGMTVPRLSHVRKILDFVDGHLPTGRSYE